MLTSLDLVVLGVYLVGVTVFGLLAGGRQRNESDYFLGGRSLPWWAVCFSIVATETSTLTVIGIPAVAYLGTLAFFQLTFGYLLGRIVVAAYFVPKYYTGSLVSAYGFLERRFGKRMQIAASGTFMVTRLLADGVRLFASAIPIKVIADAAGWSIGYFEIILCIGLVTIAYTYVGGIKAVVWMDVVQMVIYLGGAVWAVILLMNGLPDHWFTQIADSGKSSLIVWGLDGTFGHWVTSPYTLITATIGGAIFSLASHGTDQLIVQRLLACRNQSESRKAIVVSALVVMFQFALFLAVGLLLWIHYDGASLSALGLSRGDEVFPKFIIEGMPPGVSGLLLAGILAAAMSTLSASLNALASSSVVDVYHHLKKSAKDSDNLMVSRIFTLIWGVIFIAFANLFENQQNPVVELGLAIASFTYGGLLGAFLMGMLGEKIRQREALWAFGVTIAFMVWVIFGIWYSPETQSWVFTFYPSASVKATLGLRGIAWPWYPAIGAGAMLFFGEIARRVAGPHEPMQDERLVT